MLGVAAYLCAVYTRSRRSQICLLTACGVDVSVCACYDRADATRSREYAACLIALTCLCVMLMQMPIACVNTRQFYLHCVFVCYARADAHRLDWEGVLMERWDDVFADMRVSAVNLKDRVS